MITPKIHTARHRLGFFMAALIAALVFNPDAVPKTAAQDKCVQEMVEAREKYNNGEFSAAIAIVGNCLRQINKSAMSVCSNAFRRSTFVGSTTPNEF